MSVTRTRAIAAMAGTGAAIMLLAACGGASGGLYGGSGASSSAGTAKSAVGKIAVGSTKAGQVLVDPNGMTLYAFAPDSRGHSSCSGSCLQYWPAVPGKDAKSVATAKVTAHLGTIKRSDGTSQLTVNGYPMYTYVGDSKAGQDNGQGQNSSGGLWWVVSPNGSWIKASSGSGSSSSSSSSSSGGGGGGY
jgi:predicted lipoprotein with Yx(FWY)xxD motif